MNEDIKLAVISIGYKCDEWISEVWTPWINRKDVSLSFVYGITPENYANHLYPDERDTITFDKISRLLIENPKYIFDFQTEPMIESQLRNVALENLRKNNVEFDYLMIMDADDEIYAHYDIDKIKEYIVRDPFIGCYKIPFRNYINYRGRLGFYRGFKPYRVWNNKLHGGIDRFYWDNDICYKDGTNQSGLSTRVVPIEIEHRSWCGSEDRLSRKVDYQEAHFSSGYGCGYQKADIGVEFNEGYYNRTGEKKPFIEYE